MSTSPESSCNARHAHLRSDRAVFRLLVEAALFQQVDRDHLAAQALEVERDVAPGKPQTSGNRYKASRLLLAGRCSAAARCQILPRSISATSSAERLVIASWRDRRQADRRIATTSASLFMNSRALGASSS